MRYRLRRYISLMIILAVIGILYLLPMTFPFTFTATTLIYPTKMWSLRSDLDGNFFGEVKNFRTGVVEISTSYRFERGDVTNLIVSEAISRNPVVFKGDTIGRLTSRLIDQRIEELENQLAIDERLLESSKTGEKDEVIQNLKQKVQLAEQQFDLAKKNYDRLKDLFDQEVVPSSEFEIAENEYHTSLTNLEIAQSDYSIAQTGLKPEALLVIQERIARYRREIDFQNTTKKEYLIISPLSGKIVVNQYMQTQEEYISIFDTSEYIVYAPVKYRYTPYLDMNMRISFNIQNSPEVIEAKIFNISDKVDHISGHQVVFVKAHVLPSSGKIQSGLSMQVRFRGEPVTLREYIKRTIEIFIL